MLLVPPKVFTDSSKERSTRDDSWFFEKQQGLEEENIIPDQHRIKFSEYNPLNLKAYEDGTEIQLMTYRQEVPQGCKRRGIIFFLHGHGEYCENSAFMFKLFAENGYESFAMDQRGFGNSGGLRGYQGTGPTIYNDIDLFVYHTLRKYKIDPEQTPLFLVGVEFGGVLSFNYSTSKRKLFKGQALIAPLFNFKNQFLSNQIWMWKTLQFFDMSTTIPKTRDSDSDYYQTYRYFFNDKKRVDFYRIQSFITIHEEHERALENSKSQNTPTLMITSDSDDLVSNGDSLKVFNLVDNPQNIRIELEDIHHLSIYLEFEKCQKIVYTILNYFDSIIYQ